MAWYNTFDSIFWIAICGAVSGSLIVICKYCYKCKITETTLCCGLVKLTRNTTNELNDIEKQQSDETIPQPSPSGAYTNIFNKTLTISEKSKN